jgi:F-type H+-transporting ATPase subunit a
MTKKERKKAILIFSLIALVFMVGSILTGGHGGHDETVQVMMRDAVMHDVNKVSLFGLKDVNPALISGFIVSGIMIVFALICRLFVIPRFKLVPGKFQLVLETVVGILSNMAKENSHINKFLGAYIFAAGSYIFTGTLFELLGVQAITTSGHAISLPAPFADVNGAIMMGCL